MRKELHVIAMMFCAAALLLAQQEQRITVKSGEVNNGVVIVNAQAEKKSLELRCNKDFTECRIPEAGTYVMVRLPKNWGLYDCADVRVYRQTTDTEGRQLVGEYCLVEEK